MKTRCVLTADNGPAEIVHALALQTRLCHIDVHAYLRKSQAYAAKEFTTDERVHNDIETWAFYYNGLKSVHINESNFLSEYYHRWLRFRAHNLTQPDPDGPNGTFYLDDVDCYSFNGFYHLTQTYYLPCIIFVGLVGNLLSCIVFLNTHLKMRSSSYYLAALACADFGFLFTLLVVWLGSALDVEVINVNGYCQCIVYVSSVCGFLSVWLIVAFTVERFIAVQYPLHRPFKCTVARAKAIVMYLVVFAVLANSYVFVTSGIIQLEDGSQLCEMLEVHHQTMYVINIVDSLVTLVLPLVLIVVMNAMIAINLFRFSEKYKGQGGEQDQGYIHIQPLAPASRSSSHNNNNSNHSNQRRSLAPQHSFHSSNSFSLQQPRHHESSSARPMHISGLGKGLISTKTQHSITKMLLLISSVFLLLNLPSYVVRLYVFLFRLIWAQTPPGMLWCVQQMFMSLYYTNFSVNFLLYSMCGITFRRCLWQLLRNKVKCITKVSRVPPCCLPK